jgi:hypothetical protein
VSDGAVDAKRVVFACCFCGGSGADRGLALVDMDGEFEQQWWCHVECLLERMAAPARSAYVEPS